MPLPPEAPGHAAPGVADHSPPSTPRWVWVAAVVLVAGLLCVELVLGGPALLRALEDLRSPVWGWIALSVVAEAASMGMFARMQNRLLRAAGTRVHIVRSAEVAYAAHSLSVSLPGGPAFSTAFNYTQMRRFGASPAVATWCIAISGLLSTSALALIGVVAGFLARDSGNPSALVGAVLSALAIAVVVRVVALRSYWLIGPAEWLLTRLNLLTRRPPERGLDRITNFLRQFSAVRTRARDVRVAMGWAIGNWVLDLTGFALCCLAASAEGLSITQLMVTYAAGMAASTIPLVPAGLGVVDGALALGLVAGGTPMDDAIASVLLYRVVSLVLIGAVGWVLWLLLRRSHERHDTGALPAPNPPSAALARAGWFAGAAQWRLHHHARPSRGATDRSDTGGVE